MNIFYSPSKERIYITHENPVIAPLPVGLDVTINKSGFPGKITGYSEETQKYTLDILGSIGIEATALRFSPELVDVAYNNETNTITFSSKSVSGGRKKRTHKKLNKKHNATRRH